MNTGSITGERLSLALDQLRPADGTTWEEFANSYLASDFPQLRPVAGIHDKGRDAFLYEPDGEPGIYVQHSLQKDFRSKILKTLEDLRKNGFNPAQLVYCTPLDIIKQVDELKRELRHQGVALDVRDRAWFVTFRNTSNSRVAASEQLAVKYVDPLVRKASASANLPHALSDAEERTALAYFQLSVEDRDSEKSIVKQCYETLVRLALRATTPESLMTLEQILAVVRTFVPNEDSAHLKDKVKGTISRLGKKGVIKHHSAAGGYTLSKTERDAQLRKVETLLAEQAILVSEASDIITRTASSLEIDYEFDVHSVAHDALLLCDYFLLESGRSAAQAFESKVFFNPSTTTLVDFAKKLVNEQSKALKSLTPLTLAKFVDLVPASAEQILKHPTGAIGEYLGRVADAYYLLFVLRQSPEVIQVVEKVVGRSQLLLDASTIIPCMIEILLPLEQRRNSAMLAAARDTGVQLYVSQEGLTELLAAMKKARAIYVSDLSRGFHYGSSGFVEAYRQNAGSFASFNAFLDEFAGPDNPFEDLKLFLKHELDVEFVPLDDERARIDPALLEEMAAELKPARRTRNISDEMEELLVRNDVTCLLLIEGLRKRDDPLDPYGFSWWWVSADRVAYEMDRRRNSPKACACMSPDFLLRYLSVQPRRRSGLAQPSHHLPLVVEVAAADLIPFELKQAVEAALAKAEELPKYMRIRKVREVIHEARKPDRADAESGG